LEQVTYNSPDEEILGYIAATFTKEYGAELTNAISVLYMLQDPEIQEDLLSVINGPESEDPEVLMTSFNSAITSSIDKLFPLFGIVIEPTASLATKNAIVSALHILLDVEDVVPYIRILETDLTPLEKVVKLVTYFSQVSEIELHETIVDVDAMLIHRLRISLESREENNDDAEVDIKQIENFKAFCQYLGRDHLGARLVEGGIRIGMPMAVYMPFVAKLFEEAGDLDVAKDLLGFYLICSDTWEAPVETFRRDSEIILKNYKNFLAVETSMRSMLQGFEQYKRSLNESL